MNIYQTKESLKKMDVEELKKEVVKDAWVSLKQYFDGAGNGNEAKVAVVTLGISVKEKQADNNKRAIDLAYTRTLGRLEIEEK